MANINPAALNKGNTLQRGINEFNQDMTAYSIFMGGTNTKHGILKQYDPLKTGYSRIFVTRTPRFMELMYENKTRQFRHLLEYGFTAVDGIQGTTAEFAQMTGGYVGNSIDVFMSAKDDTNEITIKVYEYSGSPVREYTDLWITGMGDHKSGIAHYHGAMNRALVGDLVLDFSQHNHTMEMFYVSTDPTGLAENIEYACLLTNMMPKSVKKDHFNYATGSHELVEMDLTFTCNKYESRQINDVAKVLLGRFNILRDYLDFHSGYKFDGNNNVQVPSGDGFDTLSVPSINDWQALGGN